MLSTMSIMPATNKIVAQLMPVDALSLAPDRYQNDGVTKLSRLRVSQMALPSCIHRPNTTTSIKSPQPMDI